MICFLAKQGLAFRGHNENPSSLNRGNFLELLNFIAEKNPTLKQHLQNSTVFSGTSKSIQNDLISAIQTVMNNEIRQQVENTEFVSIILDETSDYSNKSQLSVIFRYYNSSEDVIERLVIIFVKLMIQTIYIMLYYLLHNNIYSFDCE